MRVVVITPPTATPVTWERAKAHLRLDGDDEQDYVMGLMAAATGTIDGPSGWLGQAICPQTLEARLDGFPACGGIELPYPPLISLESLVFIDSAGVSQAITVPPEQVLGNVIEPAWGSWWPAARTGPETVRVRYQAGYPVVPFGIQAALLLMVGDLYNNRETTAAGIASAIPMSIAVNGLLAPFRQLVGSYAAV